MDTASEKKMTQVEKAFCEKAASFVNKEFNLQGLLETLSLLDAPLVKKAHIEKKLLVRLGLSSFSFAKRLILYNLFYDVTRKHADFFDAASPALLQAYNKIVDSIFQKNQAKKLHAKKRSKEVLRKKLSLKKRIDALAMFEDLHDKAAKTPQALASIEDIFDQRMQKIETYQNKAKKVAEALSQTKLQVPSVFVTPAQRESEKTFWQALINHFQTLIDDAKESTQTFSSEDAYNAFLEQKNALLEDVGKKIASFQLAHRIKNPCDSFCQKTKQIAPFLYKAYVEEFLSEIEHRILQSVDISQPEKEITEILKTQQEYLLTLHDKVQEGIKNTRTNLFSSIQKRMSQVRGLYKDIRKRAEAIFGSDFYDALPKQRIITQEVFDAVCHEMKRFFADQEKLFTDLEEVVKKRYDQVYELEFFKKDYLNLMAPQKLFKDLEEAKDAFTEQVKVLPLTKQDIELAAPDEIQKLIDDRFIQKESMKNQVHMRSEELRNKLQNLEMRLQDAKQTIRRRLFEVFTGISAYRDLAETYELLRQDLHLVLVQAVDDFYSGKKSIFEVISTCEDLAYMHDVVKLRNEISHRSRRLKDLRDEAYKLFQSFQHYRRLIECNPIISRETLYRDFLFVLRALKEVISQIENPFEAFSDATNKDEINFVFRSMWMKIEELQPKIEMLQEEAKKRLKLKPEYVQKAFLKTVDTLEEVVKGYEGSRPNLVTRLENELRAVSNNGALPLLEEKISELERLYPFIKPFSFYMQIQDFRLCQEHLLRAKELYDLMQETISFAKSMQYIKTFEEERVDVILEGFERAFLFQDEQSVDQSCKEHFDAHKKLMQRTAYLIVEEVLLDIGLLDMHALMDVDQARLRKILGFANQKAAHYVASQEFGLEAKCTYLQTLDASPYNTSSKYVLCQKSYEHLVRRLAAWKKMQIDENTAPDALLEHLRMLCHDLFDVKVMKAVCEKNRIAKSLAIVSDLRTLSLEIQLWLESERGKKSGFWGTPWIGECLAIRLEIQRFEPNFFTASEFRPLIAQVFEKVYQIPEIAARKAKGEDPLLLETFAKECDLHLVELENLTNEAKKEFPFFYLPGYLRFFSHE